MNANAPAVTLMQTHVCISLSTRRREDERRHPAPTCAFFACPHGKAFAPPRAWEYTMQLSRIGVSFGLAMLVASAALAQKVTTDYARGTDFGRYKTFSWIKEPKAANPLVNQRIVE